MFILLDRNLPYDIPMVFIIALYSIVLAENID